MRKSLMYTVHCTVCVIPLFFLSFLFLLSNGYPGYPPIPFFLCLSSHSSLPFSSVFGLCPHNPSSHFSPLFPKSYPCFFLLHIVSFPTHSFPKSYPCFFLLHIVSFPTLSFPFSCFPSFFSYFLQCILLHTWFCPIPLCFLSLLLYPPTVLLTLASVFLPLSFY